MKQEESEREKEREKKKDQTQETTEILFSACVYLHNDENINM